MDVKTAGVQIVSEVPQLIRSTLRTESMVLPELSQAKGYTASLCTIALPVHGLIYNTQSSQLIGA